jgi:hypothetical protein
MGVLRSSGYLGEVQDLRLEGGGAGEVAEIWLLQLVGIVAKLVMLLKPASSPSPAPINSDLLTGYQGTTKARSLLQHLGLHQDCRLDCRVGQKGWRAAAMMRNVTLCWMCWR